MFLYLLLLLYSSASADDVDVVVDAASADVVVDICYLCLCCYYRFILDHGRYAQGVSVSSARIVSSKSAIDEGVSER